VDADAAKAEQKLTVRGW